MAASDQVWAEAVRTLESGKPFALATVVNVRGSTPREIGAKMIVRDDGQFGTIGGGCGEAEVFRNARMLLRDGSGGRMTEVDLTGDFDQRQIGTCGGIMDVFVDLWSPDRDLETARKLADAVRDSRPAALLMIVDPGERAEAGIGARAVIDPSDFRNQAHGPIQMSGDTVEALVDRTTAATPALLEIAADGSLAPVVRIEPNGAPRVFIDPVSGAQRLVIAGAGHIAQPLCALGAMLGFHVIVIDDRASFANRERFPMAHEIIVKPFRAAIESLALDRHCYLVSVTRGHAFDEETVHAALKTDCGFVGMIGSRRRVRATLERLGEAGIPKERLEQVHAPLGLDMGAETPEEIAVSIVSEIIRERRTGRRDDLNLGAKLGRLKRSS